MSEDDFDSESLSLHVVVICVSLSFSLVSSLVDFYLTCFFTRFSSWKAQPLSDDAHTKII